MHFQQLSLAELSTSQPVAALVACDLLAGIQQLYIMLS